MGTARGMLYLLLALAVICAFGLMLGQISTEFGPAAAWAQPEEEEEEEEIQTRPNPMERPADTSQPAMKPGALLLPAEMVGTSEPAMKPGGGATGSASSSPSVPGATPGGPDVMDDGGKRGIIIVDSREAVLEEGAGGRMQLFFINGNSKVLAPDGTYQTQSGRQITVSGGQASSPIDPVTHGGGMQSPSQMQMPGKMR